MSNVVDLQSSHFVKENLTDVYNSSKVIKKGDIIDILDYNINNCTFKIKSINNTIMIHEDTLRFLQKIKQSD